MRILQIIQRKQLRGAEIFACQLSVELQRKGSVVDVVYLFDGPAPIQDFEIRLIPLHGDQKKRFRDIKAYKRLSDIIRNGKYDIVQANAADTLKYAVFSKFMFRWNAKVVFRNASHMGDFIRNSVQRSFNRWLLRRCDYVISVSEISRLDMVLLYAPAALKSITIPIGTGDFSGIPPFPREVSLNEPIVINIGSFVPEKNHLFLLEVFGAYCGQNHRGHLWLIGDGALRSKLEEKIEQLDIKDRVHFWGYRKDAISFLKSADLLLMPSLIEGLPGVILEAISCEVPVIASAVGGIPEIIENDITGICITDCSVDQYVKAMNVLLSDEVYKNRLVRNAKQKLLEKFTIEKIASDFFTQYQKLIDK